MPSRTAWTPGVELGVQSLRREIRPRPPQRIDGKDGIDTAHRVHLLARDRQGYAANRAGYTTYDAAYAPCLCTLPNLPTSAVPAPAGQHSDLLSKTTTTKR